MNPSSKTNLIKLALGSVNDSVVTEPKMKIYFSLNVEDIDKISTEFVNQYIDSIK